MKKLTAILLTLCICATVIGCNDDTGKKSGGTTPPASTPKAPTDKGK